MARMPASTPTKIIRSEDWLPGESVTIRTYEGDKLRGAIQDALVEITRHGDGDQTVRYTPNLANHVRLVGHIVGWTLYEETEPGVAGKEIPFTPENLENLDPEYARWILAEIQKQIAAWRTVAKGGETPAEQTKFPEAAV
jgi:hypothetical protein